MTVPSMNIDGLPTGRYEFIEIVALILKQLIEITNEIKCLRKEMN